MSVSKDELKEMIRVAVQEALKEQNSQRPVESHSDHVSNCPDCFKETMEKLNETSEYVCRNCGLPLGNKEFAEKIPKCPNCGHTRVERVTR